MQNFAADPFVLQNAPNSAPRWVELQVQVDETLGGNPVATLSLKCSHRHTGAASH